MHILCAPFYSLGQSHYLVPGCDYNLYGEPLRALVIVFFFLLVVIVFPEGGVEHSGVVFQGVAAPDAI